MKKHHKKTKKTIAKLKPHPSIGDVMAIAASALMAWDTTKNMFAQSHNTRQNKKPITIDLNPEDYEEVKQETKRI